MFCTRCGTQGTEGSQFCTACGASLLTGAPPAGAASDPGAGYYPGATPYAAAAPPRRLRRVLSEKKIAGVCAGFAEYFDMDVTLVRLIWLALFLLPPSPGLIIYIVAWAILPKS